MAGEKILVVDDEPSVSGLLSGLLGRSGYVMATASRPDEALVQLQATPDFDLVLSDVMMAEADGFSLLDRIRIDHPGLPVVMVTAVHDIRVATNAFRRGAVDYLLKPFSSTNLLSVVERALEHGRLIQQNALYRHNLEEMVEARTERLRLTMQDLERSYDITLEAMGDALDLRDAETEGHSRRVTAYATALAREAGLDAEELRTIARGAFLHDIGKIATPDSVLLKPGKLDEAETAIMREHCERGYAMVSKIPFLQGASEIVLAHQESFDGTGYPRGLAGEGIPLGARIFAIADTLDAITSDRPYRQGASFEAARREIARCSGRQFDPAIVDIFLQVPVGRWPELAAETFRLAGMGSSAVLLRPALVC
jgi:putative nucleotidyltransferase with HDIG domain